MDEAWSGKRALRGNLRTSAQGRERAKGQRKFSFALQHDAPPFVAHARAEPLESERQWVMKRRRDRVASTRPRQPPARTPVASDDTGDTFSPRSSPGLRCAAWSRRLGGSEVGRLSGLGEFIGSD
jgi:hypothetical protein